MRLLLHFALSGSITILVVQECQEPKTVEQSVNPTEERRYFILYNSEIRFVDEFLVNLKIKGIDRIPFDNEDFYNGVDSMALNFKNKRNELGNISNELSLLFIKNPFENVYKRFYDAISQKNGSYLSFINPDYVIGVLDLTYEDAEYIMAKTSQGPWHL